MIRVGAIELREYTWALSNSAFKLWHGVIQCARRDLRLTTDQLTLGIDVNEVCMRVGVSSATMHSLVAQLLKHKIVVAAKFTTRRDVPERPKGCKGPVLVVTFHKAPK